RERSLWLRLGFGVRWPRSGALATLAMAARYSASATTSALAPDGLDAVERAGRRRRFAIHHHAPSLPRPRTLRAESRRGLDSKTPCGTCTAGPLALAGSASNAAAVASTSSS